MNHKIILGTVQLGVQYGISNSTGRPSQREAFKILDCAFEHDIKILDTADDYGEAVNIVGEYHENTGRRFGIINKFKVDSRSLKEKLCQSLKQLRCSSLYCYMYHSVSDYNMRLRMEELVALKNQGLTQKIGVSIYRLPDMEAVIEDPEIDVIQIPLNILDFDEKKQRMLEKAKIKGKEIHARSVYLQGLIFREVASLSGNMTGMKPYLEKIASISQENDVDLKKAALNFVVNNNLVNFAVIGTETSLQLSENLSLVDPGMDTTMFSSISVAEEDSFLLNPANWKP